jgi:hypothetical protein
MHGSCRPAYSRSESRACLWNRPSSVDEMVGIILKKDRKNDLAFVENVIAGKPVDKCLANTGRPVRPCFPMRPAGTVTGRKRI